MVDSRAMVIPETIDALRALIGRPGEPHESFATTNAARGLGAVAQAIGGR